VLVAFLTYLPSAVIGGHGGAFARLHLPPRTFAAALMPYLFGPIFGFRSRATTPASVMQWGSVGGYVTCSLLVLAFFAFAADRYKPERVLLAGWTVITLVATYGFPVALGYP